MSRGMYKVVVGLWALLVVATLPARAAEAQDPRAYVLLIGVGQAADKEVPARPHAEEDAKALYDLFTDAKYLGVEPERVRLLLSKPDARRKSQPATRENILKALSWLAEEPGRDDLVILGFFGQGTTLGGKADRLSYYASDSTVKDRAKNAVAAAEVAERLDKLKSQRFAAFVDVSFQDDKGEDPFSGLHDDSAPYREFLGSEEKEEKSYAPGRILYLASSGRLPALDMPKHGLFAHVLLAGLKGEADREGYEADGNVTVDELTEYLKKQAPELIRKHAKTPDEHDATPLVLGGREAHFVLTHNPAAVAKAKGRLQKFQQLGSKDEKLSPELIQEGTNLLKRMPKLDAQQDLRKVYQQLADGKVTVDQFLERRDEILDATKLKRSLALAYARKVMSGISAVRESYVKEVNQGELVGWAIRGLYRRLDEKIPQEISERLAKARKLKTTELVVLLTDVRERLGKREDLADGKDVDISLQQMLRHLDPYTTYFDSEAVERMKSEIGGYFTGIGIQIEKDRERDLLRVKSPIMGSPAYKAGLQAGDLILKVIREEDSFGKKLDKPEVISTKGLSLTDAVKKILGREGTKVKVVVEREGADKPLEFDIVRGRVELETVLGHRRNSDDSWNYVIDPEHKIGYVRLTQFSRNSFRDLLAVVKDLEKQKVKGLVFDLRFNPGGLLDQAVRICDMFIDGGLIVTVKPRVGREQSYTAEMHDKAFTRFPMVVLVNGYSASGSEIVAACLQDHHRAIVLGERSYGKGSVQNIQPFESGELKVTIASFHRPSGKNLNKSSTSGRDDEDWGVSPDDGYAVPLSRKEREDLAEHQRAVEIIQSAQKRSLADKEEFKDKQLEAALEYLRSQIKTAAYKATAKKAG